MRRWKSGIWFIFMGMVYFPLFAGAQNTASSIMDGTVSITPTLGEFPVTLTVDGYVLSITASTADKARSLQQWQTANSLGFWGLIVLMVLFFFGWWEIRNRKRQFEEHRELLFSKNPEEVIAAAKGLAGYPLEAYRLVLRWAQEYRVNKKYFDRELSPDTPLQQIIQAIQDALDGMVDRKSWIWQWKPLKPQWPSYIGYPLVHQIKGARLEEKTLTIDLGPIQLKGAYMVNGNFHKISLQNAKLWDANLRGANLAFSHLQESVFSEAHLEEADLTQARLEGADMESAHLEGANLAGAHLDMACLNDAHLDGANLAKAFMKKTLLSGASLKGVNFTGAHLEEADLTEARLDGAVFQNAYLHGVYFLRSHLEGAKLFEVNLEWAILEEGDYLSYVQRQSVKLSVDQEEIYQRWNASHPAAPWLQDDWKFWWQFPEIEQPRKKQDEIRIVRSFIDEARIREQSKRMARQSSS